MKNLYCFGAVLLLTGRCQAFQSNADEWMQVLTEVRDSFRQVCPIDTNQRPSTIQAPFGWILQSDNSDIHYIRFRHIFDSTAVIRQEHEGHAVRVDWHVKFRKEELRCLSSHSFSYHLPRNWNQAIQPQITLFGPISRMIKHLTVSWPETEAERFEAALRTENAPAVCW